MWLQCLASPHMPLHTCLSTLASHTHACLQAFPHAKEMLNNLQANYKRWGELEARDKAAAGKPA